MKCTSPHDLHRHKKCFHTVLSVVISAMLLATPLTSVIANASDAVEEETVIESVEITGLSEDLAETLTTDQTEEETSKQETSEEESSEEETPEGKSSEEETPEDEPSEEETSEENLPERDVPEEKLPAGELPPLEEELPPEEELPIKEELPPEELPPAAPELIDYGPNNHGGGGTTGYVTGVPDATMGAQAFGIQTFGAQTAAAGGIIYEGDDIRDIVHTQTLEYSLGGEWNIFEEGTAVQPNMRFRGRFNWSESGTLDFHEFDQVRVPLELPVNWQAFTRLGTMTFGDTDATYGTYWFEGGNYNLGTPGHLVFEFNANVEGRRLEDGFFSFEFSLNVIRDEDDQVIDISIGNKIIQIPVSGSEPGPGGGDYSKNSELITSSTGDPVKTDRGFLVSNTLAMNLEFGQGSSVYYDVPRVRIADLKQAFMRDSVELLRQSPGGSFETIDASWIVFGTDTEDIDGNGITTDEVMILDFSKIGGYQGYSYHLTYNTEIYAPDGVDLSIADIYLEGTETYAENNVWGQDGQLIIGSVVWVTENVTSNGGVQVDENSGAIRIQKTDPSDNPLYGAKFELWTGTATAPQKINKLAKTTNAQGVIIFDNLPILASGQHYWLKETVAPTGFALPKDPFTLVTRFAAMKITEVTITNSPPTGSIELTKSDAGDSTHFLSGAKFELYAGTTTATATKVRDAVSTNASGKLTFTDLPALPADQSYWLKETVAPSGYSLPADPWTQVTGFAVETTATVTLTNAQAFGSIKIIKQGETKNLLAGAKFELWKGSATAPTTKLQESTTIANGEIIWNNLPDLPSGQYYWLKEVTAPTGYVLPANPLTRVNDFKVGQTAVATVTIVNSQVVGSIKLVKQGETNNPLSGAKFEVYLGATTATATKVAEGTTNASGIFTFGNLKALTAGQSYWLKEITAPTGYLLPADPWTLVTGFEVEKTLTVTVKNTEALGSVELTKYGEKQNLLSGAQFELYSGTAGNDTATKVRGPLTTNASGKLTFAGLKALPTGQSYWVKEVKAPDGHVLPANQWTQVTGFKVGVGAVAKIEITNTEATGNIKIAKQGENDNALAGAEFELYYGTDKATATKIGDTITTNVLGIAFFMNLKALPAEQFYFIKEVKAPAGYVLPEDPWTKVENFKLQQTTTVTLTNIEAVGGIKLIKQGEKQNLLSGAQFELYSGITAETATKLRGPLTTNASGELTFISLKALPTGQSYWVKEVKAPAGHVLPANPWTQVVDFKVGVDEVVTITITNEEAIGAIMLIKHGENDNVLAGAEFALYAGIDTASATKIGDTVTTNIAGIALFTNLKALPIGQSYWVKEVKAPAGHILPEDPWTKITDFEIEKTTTATIINEEAVGEIKLIKHGEKQNPLPEGEFELYIGATAETATKVRGPLITDTNGEIIISELKAPPADQFYWLKETKAPAEHVLPKNPWTKVEDFKVEQTTTAIIANEEDVGIIELIKHGEDHKPLSGAQFELWIGNETSATSLAREALTTNESGILRFGELKKLPEGQFYWLKEVKAPAGHVLPANPWTRVADFAIGKTVSITLINDQQVGAIQIIKRGEYNRTLQGARFELWIGNYAGASTKLRSSITTSTDGIVNFSDLKILPAGQYYWIREVSAPNGYVLPRNPYTRVDGFELEQTVTIIVINNRPNRNNDDDDDDDDDRDRGRDRDRTPPRTPNDPPQRPTPPTTDIPSQQVPLGTLPGKPAPQTGAPTNFWLYVGTSLTAIAGLITITATQKRKKRRTDTSYLRDEEQ